MKTAFLLLLAVIVADAIYWIIDWKQKHPDGE